MALHLALLVDLSGPPALVVQSNAPLSVRLVSAADALAVGTPVTAAPAPAAAAEPNGLTDTATVSPATPGSPGASALPPTAATPLAGSEPREPREPRELQDPPTAPPYAEKAPNPNLASTPSDATALAANLPSVDGYVLRKALTQAPVPLQDVQVPWPAGAAATGRFRAVFSLFIDESGWPQRMVPDGPTLPPALEAQARRVFMATRFAPGQVDGRVVRSLVRIEVEFDSATPAAPAAAAASAPRRPNVVSSQNL